MTIRFARRLKFIAIRGPCRRCYPSELGTYGRAVLLASYTWSTDSQRWGSLSENAILNRALDCVVEIHKREVGEKQIRELYEGGNKGGEGESAWTMPRRH